MCERERMKEWESEGEEEEMHRCRRVEYIHVHVYTCTSCNYIISQGKVYSHQHNGIDNVYCTCRRGILRAILVQISRNAFQFNHTQ